MIRRIDRYELVEQIGTGGMAAVYRGRDTALDREVAVKVLHPHLASRAESRARFSREARAVARLSHPNIVEIYDYAGDAAPESWIVTEFVRGRTLRAYADEEGFGFPEVGALVGRAVAEALSHAHAAGVIHRDLKPENVLVCEEPGRRAIKLADFGIARIVAAEERMTMTGALVGSPNHMAPEIIEGRDADVRSDVFSLGTLLYWLTTAKLPFAAPNPTATLRRVVDGDFEDPRRASPLVSDALAELIVRTMALDPAARPASAVEVRAALDAALAESGLARPEEELASFLSDPAAFKAALPARMVAALLERGEHAIAERASAAALSFFNRVLALDPGNARVLGYLERLAFRARWRRRARGALLLMVLAAAGAGTLVALRAARQGATTTADGPPPPRSSPPAEPKEPEAPPVAAPARSSPVLPAAPPAPAARPRGGPVDLVVMVRPYAQRALLDGVEVARGEQRVTFSLSPGQRHVIQIEHPCCTPYVREIDASEASRLKEMKVPLSPRPARLRVEGDPATRVYVGSRLLGTAGDSQREPLLLAIPAGGDNPYEGQVELRLEADGQEPSAAPLKIRAGGDVTVAVPAREPTP